MSVSLDKPKMNYSVTYTTLDGKKVTETVSARSRWTAGILVVENVRNVDLNAKVEVVMLAL